MIVVTGGAGFIGSNIVAALSDRGEADIVVCDWLDDGDKWRNLAHHEVADIILPDELFAFLDARGDEVDAIVHMGAVSSTTERDVDLIVDSNIRLTLDLWNWCSVRDKRLIFASSAATYGDGEQGFDDDGSPAALAQLRPLNPYGWSKHFVDRRIARQVSRGAATPPQWAGLKFFNVYGPNEYHKEDMRSVAHKSFPAARDGLAATLFKSHREGYADGGQLRDFVYVRDCADVVLWLLDNPGVSGLYNLGTGQARSFADLIGAVYQALGAAPKIDYVDMPEEIRDRYQYFTQASMDRLRAAGYDRPFTSLEDGITDYVQNYLTRPDPFR